MHGLIDTTSGTQPQVILLSEAKITNLELLLGGFETTVSYDKESLNMCNVL